ncbi:MAG TPA: ice-binding family protein [Candidatus Saccharimonadales bacterium]|nr:ice-binding family protein [Candidatus Saccharimonadales bacterium]
MKKFVNNLTVTILVVFAILVFGLNRPTIVQAATSPSLGTAANYSVLAGSSVTNTGATTISGNVGISPGAGGTPNYTGFNTVTLGGTMHDADTAAAIAQGEMNAVFTTDLAQSCDVTYAGTKELAGVTLAPGVYCADRFFLSSGVLTLNGAASDVWVFKSGADLIVTGASSNVVFTGGGLPCNVWWRIVSTATFDAGSSFVGNILADTSITFAAGSSLDGRAFARTAEVTLDGNIISGPTCTAPLAVSQSHHGWINVVKIVINDNGGTKTVADFPLFVNDGFIASGITNIFGASNAEAYDYKVTETADSNYTRTFSGDCDVNGIVKLNPNENKFCIITNDDIGAPVFVPPIPPIIDVVKVPNPLALPAGPDAVTYTYTLRNLGTVPVTDVTMVGDTCSPITLASGDTNADAKLDVNETWVYRCSTILTETHTNTIVATGWANGLSAVDIASATVIVGLPIVPPLIHITKVPNPSTLQAGGGMVTYTKKVTNPGTVALSNVRLTDDKCNPVKYVSGDTNSDLKLDPTETWVYTCKVNLTKTTTNTVTASGDANNLTARDFAIATVVVATAVPKLPATGTANGKDILNIVALISALALTSVFIILKKRTI